MVAGKAIGAIVAGVTTKPERLTVTPRLADRLKGLAAQASTAISNARLVDQIRFQAVHDALTGLPNRALILDRTEQMLARARRSDVQVAALFIDLDGFKDVNDTLGHGVGDQLLQAVSERLSLTMRESDTIGRLGGDEFVVLVDGSTMDAGPELVAERLLEVLRSHFELPGLPAGPLTLTASIGIATGTRASATELLRDADIALYEAKAAGKNCFVAFEPEMHTAVQDHHLLEMDLREALAAQPVPPGLPAHLQSGRRPDHRGRGPACAGTIPERGVVQPDTFIPILEDSGMINEVGRWVLDEACLQGARWHAMGYELDVSVNVSARQLEHDRLIEDVRAALNASGFPLFVADHRDHRDGHHEERGRRRAPPGCPKGHRGPHRHRRLRDRLLLAGLSPAVPRRHSQDRPARSSPPWPTRPNQVRSSVPWSSWARPWVSRPWPRGSRRPSSTPSLSGSTATAVRATCMPGLSMWMLWRRSWPHGNAAISSPPDRRPPSERTDQGVSGDPRLRWTEPAVCAAGHTCWGPEHRARTTVIAILATAQNGTSGVFTDGSHARR